MIKVKYYCTNFVQFQNLEKEILKHNKTFKFLRPNPLKKN